MSIQAGVVHGSFLGDLAIVIRMDNIVFTHTEITEFMLINKINEPPSGYFKITDTNSFFMRTGSAKYGKMIFTNTSDGLDDKIATLDFYITEMRNEGVSAGSSLHFISWKAGTSQHNKKITHAYKGTSVKVMEEIFEAAVPSSNKIKFPSSDLTDEMTWITPQSNMWEQLDAVVSKSYRQNDYIFWAWDDVNDTFKISSFEVEKGFTDRYIIMESDQAVGSTNNTKKVSDDGLFTIWYFDNVKKMNRLGLDYKKIFPNVSFSGILDGDMESTGFKQKSFVEFLKEIGDTKIEEIIALEQNAEISYGDLIFKRQWPINTHKMYSFADIYRDYKFATYAKRIETQIYNNVGPPIGSKVSFVKLDDAYKSGVAGYDKMFSDKYIVIQKVILYDSTTANVASGTRPASSSNFITRLSLASDNFLTDTEQAEESTKEVMDKVT